MVAGPPAFAAGVALQIWPAPGLYGLEQTNCNRATDASPQLDSAKVHPELCALFANPETLRSNFGQFFADLVAQAFPNVVANPNQNVGDGVPVSQRLSNTLIASLHLSRADIWQVDKHTGATDVFLPFTLTLNLTNATSGEVMFTETASVIPESNFSSNNVFAPSRQEIPAQMRATIEQLVRNSAARFKPYPLDATVRAKIGDNFLIDKGRSAGLRIGDRIGPDAHVIYADGNYALIKPVLGDFKTGETVSRQVAAPADYLAKPSVIVLPASFPSAMPKAYITQIFEEAMGSRGVFSIMPVNQSFPRLREIAIGRAGMSSTANSQRSLPDYFIHLDVFAIPHTEVDTNIRGLKILTFEAYAVASIVDRSGRVVFAAVDSDRIQDQVVGGVGFSPDQRQDTVTKNALFKLSQRISGQFKPQGFRLPLSEEGKGASVNDAGGALSVGAGGLVVRKSGRFPGVDGDVWVPLGNFEVIGIEGGKAALQSQDPITPKPRRDDLFVFDGGALMARTRRTFVACSSEGTLDTSSHDFSAEPSVRSVGLAIFAQSFSAPVYLADVPALATERLNLFPGSEKLGVMKQRSEDFCFRPILRSALVGPILSKDGLVTNKYVLTMGYTLYRGEQKVAGSGLRVEMTSGSFQAGTNQSQIDDSNIRDSIAQFSTLVGGALNGMQVPD